MRVDLDQLQSGMDENEAQMETGRKGKDYSATNEGVFIWRLRLLRKATSLLSIANCLLPVHAGCGVLYAGLLMNLEQAPKVPQGLFYSRCLSTEKCTRGIGTLNLRRAATWPHLRSFRVFYVHLRSTQLR